MRAVDTETNLDKHSNKWPVSVVCISRTDLFLKGAQKKKLPDYLLVSFTSDRC
jgi:hypothetical protein